MGREGTRSGRKRSGTPTTDDAKSNISGEDNTAETKSNEKTEPQHAQNHPLARGTEGMNRRSLLTGLYGSRGERIRHVVANGALMLPEESLDIMASFGGFNNEEDIKLSSNKGKKRKTSQLPGLDSVVRPSTDQSLKKIVVTDVFHKHFAHPSDPTQPPTLRTVAANRHVDVSVTVVNPEMERIRGGGEDDKPAEATSAPAVEATQTQSTAASGAGEASAAPNPTAPVEGTQASTVNAAPTPQAISQTVESATTEKPAGNAATTTPAATQPSEQAASSSAQTVSESAPPAPTSPVAPQATTSSSSAVPTPASSSSVATPAKPTSSETPVPPASVVKPAEAATDKVIALPKKPEPHWEQHIPSANDENLTDPQAKSAKPNWYSPNTVSNLERTLLPEWFDESASHRSEETYLKARETMIHISKQLGNRFVTSTLARRSLPGDVGSLHRLHNFLTSYLWINEEGRNDSAPTAPSLQQPAQSLDKEWNDKRRGDLIEAVVGAAQANKKQKTTEEDAMEVDGGDEYVAIDWNNVAKKVGSSAGECEREFLSMQLDEASVATTAEPPATPDAMATSPARKLMSKDEMAQDELIRSLVEESSPQVIRKVTEAALIATNHDLPAAQKAARLGLIASQAAKAAQGHEETVSRLLSEVLDQRMQKLERRMALMDDLEGILEAERVALELERRDLYTTRCRDWFGNA